MHTTDTTEPPRGAWARLLATSLAAAAALTGCSGGRLSAPPPETQTVERFGALELVTHGRAERGGDATGGAWQPMQHWSLRWQGRPVLLATPVGLWGDRLEPRGTLHAVWVIEREGEALPELLVLAGDPNNTASFHRVSVAGDELHTPVVCITHGGGNAVTPLGGTAAQGPRRETLRPGGGAPAWLQLGHQCLHDLASGRTLLAPRAPDELAFPVYWGASAVAPDGSSIARVAISSQGGERLVLAQAPLLAAPAGQVPGSVEAMTWLREQAVPWQQQPIDRERLQLPRLDAADGAWLQRHWHWQQRAGRWQLLERGA